jgi:hypothetical protein
MPTSPVYASLAVGDAPSPGDRNRENCRAPGLDSKPRMPYQAALSKRTTDRGVRREPCRPPAGGSDREPCIAELCCVLDIAGNQHYPPSWVEAPISLGQVVMGRPLQRELRSGAYVGPGAGPSCPAPGDTRVGRGAGLPHLPAGLRETAVRERGDSRGGTSCGAGRPLPSQARRPALRAVAPRLLFRPTPDRIGHKKHKKEGTMRLLARAALASSLFLCLFVFFVAIFGMV